MSVASESRSVRPAVALDGFFRDLRHAWRGLWKAPTFAVVVIATLALGIGATTAIFSVVNAMLIAPLPYRDSSSLVLVWSDMTRIGYPRAPLSGPELFDLRERSTLFTGFSAIWATAATLNGDGEPEQARIGVVTTNFFQVLGVNAALGRTFSAEDEQQALPAGLLLSSALWHRRYGGDPTIVGRSIRMNGLRMTVLGIMPPDFKLLLPRDANIPDDLDLWMPFTRTLADAPRTQQYLRVVGRLRPGATVEQGQREIAGIASQISKEFVAYGAGGRVLNAVALQRDGVRDIRTPLLTLFGAVGILLAIACLNVANLLMARAASRTKETALRVALGAGRGQLLRLSVAEGLVLAALGGGAGLLVGDWGLGLLIAHRPESLSRIASARIDPMVLGFTAGTALVWGLLFSLAPVLVRWRTDAAQALQREGRDTRGTMHYRARAALVIAQIALGVVLLVGAELMGRTFLALQRVDLGFRTDASMLTFRLVPGGPRYRTLDAVNAFARTLQTKLTALPGVTGVGAVTHLPFDHIGNWAGPYTQQVGAPKASAPLADYRAIGPGYLETMGAQLLDGRFFTESDDQTGDQVVIVDESFAHKFWPGQRAIGQHFAVDPDSTGRTVHAVTVVGVVRHLRIHSVTEEGREQIYLPWRQTLWSPMAFVVRASGDAAALTSAVKQAVAQVDPLLAVYDVRPFDEYTQKARATQRFTMILAASFAAVALVLACVGVYGVMAYSVARRRHEFGIRLALGAQPGELVRLVLNDGLKLTACGLAIGVAAGLAGGTLLQNQLFGVTAHDVASYALAVPVLGACALAACLIPAWRATVNSPLNALRAE